ncbi:hypothetical protein QQP08_007749 [Theobroma cacao]|nr:hypothetical protein QQP08_007749 [Theobroma cacao]
MRLTNKVKGDIEKTFASFLDERKLVFNNLAIVDHCWDTRCSLLWLYKLLQTIGFESHDSIHSMRLGVLIHLQEHKLKWNLCLWLIEMMDLNKRCLKLYDYEIPLISEMIVFLNHISGARFDSTYGQSCFPQIVAWNQENIAGWLTLIKDFKNPKMFR